MMKKAIAILLAALLALGMFAACGSKNSKSEKDPEELILGSWKSVSAEGDSDDLDYIKMFAESGGITLTFRDDGTFAAVISYSGYVQNQSGEYRIKGSKLLMDGSDPATFKVSSKKLTLTADGVTVKFERTAKAEAAVLVPDAPAEQPIGYTETTPVPSSPTMTSE